MDLAGRVWSEGHDARIDAEIAHTACHGYGDANRPSAIAPVMNTSVNPA